jgi:hypothetical protein
MDVWLQSQREPMAFRAATVVWSRLDQASMALKMRKGEFVSRTNNSSKPTPLRSAA